jgi:hypothetical protein
MMHGLDGAGGRFLIDLDDLGLSLNIAAVIPLSRRRLEGKRVYIVSHRTAVDERQDGSVSPTNGGIPVLLRGLVSNLDRMGVPNLLVTGQGTPGARPGDVTSSEVTYAGARYNTRKVDLGQYKTAADRWIERLFGDRAAWIAEQDADLTSQPMDARPFTELHRQHLRRVAALHDMTMSEDSTALQFLNHVVGLEVDRQIQQDDLEPVILAVGPVFHDIPRNLSPRSRERATCIYWSDVPWIVTKLPNGADLPGAPAPRSISRHDSVITQTKADAQLIRAAFAERGETLPSLTVRPALPNLREFEALTSAPVTDAELETWRSMPHRLTAAGGHARRNIIGQLLAYAHRISLRPDLQEKAQMFVHLRPCTDLPGVMERKSLLQMTKDINGRYGTASWKPVVTRVSHDRALEGALNRECTVMAAMAASEGMGFAPLQFLVANPDGVCIVSKQTGAREVAGEHLLIADAADIEDMSQRLGEAMDMTHEDARALSAGAREKLMRSDVDTWVAGVLDVAEQTMTGPLGGLTFRS